MPEELIETPVEPVEPVETPVAEAPVETPQEAPQAPVEPAQAAIETVAEVPAGPPVIIKPTIGRVVLFRPDAAFAATKGINLIDADLDDAQPLTAQIAYVHDDYTVNLAGFDQYGYPFNATRVNLLTGNETVKPEGAFAHWMEYQITQALKAGV